MRKMMMMIMSSAVQNLRWNRWLSVWNLQLPKPCSL